MLRVILWINQVHSVRDLAGLVKNKTKDGLSDGSVICNNEKVLIKHHLRKENGAPERIRTSDRSVRSRVLYPAELRARYTLFRRMPYQGGVS
jgi:hypothetical protein